MIYLFIAFELVDPPLPHPIPWPELDRCVGYPDLIVAGAQYVVTDNLRHSPPRDPATKRRIWNGIEYITYNNFIGLVG